MRMSGRGAKDSMIIIRELRCSSAARPGFVIYVRSCETSVHPFLKTQRIFALYNCVDLGDVVNHSSIKRGGE